MEKNNQVKSFDRVNGLGTISFSPELITNIIKKVLSSYRRYEYLSHTIQSVQHDYYEVTIKIKVPKEMNFKEIDRLHKELLLVMKQSLSLTCVVALNIENV